MNAANKLRAVAAAAALFTTPVWALDYVMILPGVTYDMDNSVEFAGASWLFSASQGDRATLRPTSSASSTPTA